MEGGGTLRDHLESMKRSGRMDPPELKVGEPPPELHAVLPVFRHLALRRRYEQGVPLPVLDSETAAYCALHRLALSVPDLQRLALLDGIWLAAVRKTPAVE